LTFTSQAQVGGCISIAILRLSTSGIGDLFAALILAWSHHPDSALSEAVHKATASLQAVCKRTFEACSTTAPTFRERELKLVASKVGAIKLVAVDSILSRVWLQREIEHPDTSTVELSVLS